MTISAFFTTTKYVVIAASSVPAGATKLHTRVCLGTLTVGPASVATSGPFGAPLRISSVGVWGSLVRSLTLMSMECSVAPPGPVVKACA